MSDIILDWIVGPLMNLLSSKYISGRWRLSHLFPIATALGVGLWWVGDRFDLVLVVILGVLITVVAGIASIVTFIPREAAFSRDVESFRAKQQRKAEAAEKEPQKES